MFSERNFHAIFALNGASDDLELEKALGNGDTSSEGCRAVGCDVVSSTSAVGTVQ